MRTTLLLHGPEKSSSSPSQPYSLEEHLLHRHSPLPPSARAKISLETVAKRPSAAPSMTLSLTLTQVAHTDNKRWEIGWACEHHLGSGAAVPMGMAEGAQHMFNKIKCFNVTLPC